MILLALISWAIIAGACAWAWHLGYEAGHEHGREYERVRIQNAVLDCSDESLAGARAALDRVGRRLGWPA